MDDNDIPRIPSISDRGFLRVNGTIYLYCEPAELDNGNQHEYKEFLIPTFVQDEDDFVGLSIDAFREMVLHDKPKDADYLLKVQQLLSMMKRFQDSAMLGRKQNMYKKVNVNISGSGVAFPSDVAYHAGQVLNVSMFFPQVPFINLNVMTDVVRSEKAEIGYEIKVKYKNLSEETRQKILNFIDECEKK